MNSLGKIAVKPNSPLGFDEWVATQTQPRFSTSKEMSAAQKRAAWLKGQQKPYQNYINNFSYDAPLTDGQLRASIFGGVPSFSDNKGSTAAEQRADWLKNNSVTAPGQQVNLPEWYTSEYGYDPSSVIMPDRQLTGEEAARAKELWGQDMRNRPDWAKNSSNPLKNIGKNLQSIAETGVKAVEAGVKPAAIMGGAILGGNALAGLMAPAAGGAVSTAAPTAMTASSGLGMGATPTATTLAGAGGLTPTASAATGAVLGSTGTPAATTNAVGGAVNSAAPTAMTASSGIGMGSTPTATTLAGAGGLAANDVVDAITNTGTNVVGNALSNNGWNAVDWANLGGSLASGYLSHQATGEAMDEIARQYDQNRADMAPWRESGVNALNTYNEELGLSTPGYDAFTAPSGSDLPEYQSTGEFNFDLENDPVYQNQLAESEKAIKRYMAGKGYANSGNILYELGNNAVTQAGKYQNDAFNRQLAQSRENYGRNVSDYGINTDRANTVYNRGVNEYGMGVGRNQDFYGRNQDYLNRLAALSGTGQTATAYTGNQGADASNALADLNIARGSGYNNAIQGGLENYLLNYYLR